MDVANGAHQTLIELFRSRHEVLFILKPGQLTSGKKNKQTWIIPAFVGSWLQLS
jgi:hypothetical protein